MNILSVPQALFCLATNTKVISIADEIASVKFNPPATIVFWKDRTKTVVKCQKGESFDKEKGLAMAIVKKVCGNKSNFNKVLKQYIVE